MREARTLIIVNSVYQLLTAVHMRRELSRGIPWDLVATDVIPDFKKYVSRIKELGIFDRVLEARVMELNRTYGLADEKKLSEGFDNAESLLRFCLSQELGTYSTVYFSNFDIFTRMLACRYFQDDCDFICYEDGFSTYVIDYLREDRALVNRHPEGKKLACKVKEVLLYEPRLAMRGDRLPNRPLPKIAPENRELVEILNYIFDYRKPEQEARFLFLEQSFRAEGIATNDLELMRLCRDTVGQQNFLVKPHPRNPENLPWKLGLSRRYESQVPWELLLLNEGAGKITLLTVCSNAALTGRLVFGQDLNTVMLYRLFQGKVLWKEDPVLQRYLKKFRVQFAGKNYYVPENVYELGLILDYLGGQHE